MAQTLLRTVPAVSPRKPKKEPKLPALTKNQIRELIRLLDVAFTVQPRIIFSKRAKRKFCYVRRPVMQLSRVASLQDVLHEYGHALAMKRDAEASKPHSKAFEAILQEITRAYTSK